MPKQPTQTVTPPSPPKLIPRSETYYGFGYEFEWEPENMSNKDKNFSKWSYEGSNKFFPSDNVSIVNQVHPGVYELKYNQDRGYYMLKKEVHIDDLFTFPDNVQEKILKDAIDFWNNKENFKKYGYAYKRGILLHGGPGNGKSSIINLLCQEIIEKHNGIAITIKSEDDIDYFLSFMPEFFRVIEPDRQLLCIIEDLDGLCEDTYYETALLNILDGIGQMENTIYLGTTNYPEKLKERILNRPSRFDRRYEIKKPDDKTREYYFKKKLTEDDLSKIDLNDWVKRTKDMSLAALSDIIKSVFCLNHSLDDAIKSLKEMGETVGSYKYDKEESSIGFGGKR